MANDNNNPEYFKGRGAQLNTDNRFLKNSYTTEHDEVLDEPLLSNAKTQIFIENPKKIVNLVKSPDVPGMYSMNPTKAVNMAAYIVMPGTYMNTGATVQVSISNAK